MHGAINPAIKSCKDIRTAFLGYPVLNPKKIPGTKQRMNNRRHFPRGEYHSFFKTSGKIEINKIIDVSRPNFKYLTPGINTCSCEKFMRKNIADAKSPIEYLFIF